MSDLQLSAITKLAREKAAAEAAQAPKPAAQKEKPLRKLVTVRTVYGDMVEPISGEVFSMQPRLIERVSPWVQSQIDAKKMIVVS